MAGEPLRKGQEIVVAYGFDKTGLSIPPALQRPEYRIEWVPYGSPDIPEGVTGLIFPSGIFETIEYENNWMGYRVAVVRPDLGNLLGLERHVANLLWAGGWVAILAREIIDEFPGGGGSYSTFRALDTDLAKRLLNGLAKRTRHREGTGMVASKRDEFNLYIERWGIARTFFEIAKGGRARVLARVPEAVVGFEYNAHLFVLPFQSRDKSLDESREIGEGLTRAVIDYRRKMLVELPVWVGEFQFVGEQKLRDELAVLQEQLLRVESGLKSWEERKIILVSSGIILKEGSGRHPADLLRA